MDTLDIILRLLSQNYSSDAAFELAAGLKPKTVYDWKRGKSSSYLKMLSTLSELFNVSTDYLLGNEQKNKPTVSKDDELINEQMGKIKLLPKEVQKQVLDYIDFVIEHQDK